MLVMTPSQQQRPQRQPRRAARAALLAAAPAVAVAALACACAVAQAQTEVLYAQTSTNPVEGLLSTVWADHSLSHADDFVVPTTAEQGWLLEVVSVAGFWPVNASTVSPSSWHVRIFRDNPVSGTSNAPGLVLYDEDMQASVGGAEPAFELTPALTLAPGRYWVSVAANYSETATNWTSVVGGQVRRWAWRVQDTPQGAWLSDFLTFDTLGIFTNVAGIWVDLVGSLGGYQLKKDLTFALNGQIIPPPPPPPSPVAQSSTPDSSGAVVGAVIGSVLVLLLVAALVFVLMRKKASSDSRDEDVTASFSDSSEDYGRGGLAGASRSGGGGSRSHSRRTVPDGGGSRSGGSRSQYRDGGGSRSSGGSRSGSRSGSRAGSRNRMPEGGSDHYASMETAEERHRKSRGRGRRSRSRSSEREMDEETGRGGGRRGRGRGRGRGRRSRSVSSSPSSSASTASTVSESGTSSSSGSETGSSSYSPPPEPKKSSKSRNHSKAGGGGGGRGSGAAAAGSERAGGGDDDEVPRAKQDSREIDASQVTLGKELGRGAFGVVYAATWRGGEVAVKQLLMPAGKVVEEELEEFRGEMQTMLDLRPHVNVVQFLGFTTHPELWIVTEMLKHGSCYDLINSRVIIDDELLAKLCKGIAAGLYHLHCEDVVHRDMAARNVLLGEGYVPKVSDFGMSRKLDNQDSNQTKSDTGPLKWMAPEAIRHKTYSPKSDVWSFAVTIWEILNRQEPYRYLDAVQTALKVAGEGLRLRIPDHTPVILQQVLPECFETEPEDRPTMQVVFERFSKASEADWAIRT